MVRAITSVIARTFDFSGKTGRRDYWAYFAVYFILAIALLFVADTQPSGSMSKAGVTATAFALYLPMIAATVRRLHDVGRSGAWGCLLAFSFVGFLLLSFFTLQRSVENANGAKWIAHPVHLFGKLLVLVLAFVAISRVIWEPFYIPSGSMKPTLLIGDYLVVPLHGSDEINQGDVVTFRHPVLGHVFIARVIGMPGDTVQMRDGQVFLGSNEGDMTAARQEPNGDFIEVYARQGSNGLLPLCREKNPAQGDVCIKEKLIETLPNGRVFETLNVRDMRADNTAIMTVPDGQIFLLGDNRDNSSDSRFNNNQMGLGFVPVENVIGPVGHVVFSSAGRSLFNVVTWRWDRLWTKVN